MTVVSPVYIGTIIMCLLDIFIIFQNILSLSLLIRAIGSLLVILYSNYSTIELLPSQNVSISASSEQSKLLMIRIYWEVLALYPLPCCPPSSRLHFQFDKDQLVAFNGTVLFDTLHKKGYYGYSLVSIRASWFGIVMQTMAITCQM